MDYPFLPIIQTSPSPYLKILISSPNISCLGTVSRLLDPGQPGQFSTYQCGSKAHRKHLARDKCLPFLQKMRCLVTTCTLFCLTAVVLSFRACYHSKIVLILLYPCSSTTRSRASKEVSNRLSGSTWTPPLLMCPHVLRNVTMTPISVLGVIPVLILTCGIGCTGLKSCLEEWSALTTWYEL